MRFSPHYYLYIHMNGKQSLPRKEHLKRPFNGNPTPEKDLLKEAEYEKTLLISQQQNPDLEDLPKTSI